MIPATSTMGSCSDCYVMHKILVGDGASAVTNQNLAMGTVHQSHNSD